METLNVWHRQLRSATVRVNSYIIYAEQDALVIDPGGEPDAILSFLESRWLRLKYIVLTHGHFDHIMGTAELKHLTGAKVCMNEADAFFIRDSEWNASNFAKAPPVEVFTVDRFLREDDKLELGGQEITVLETPGHTPGEISLYIPGYLFCGDTILKGTTGRMDLPGADVELAKKMIRRKIFTLPEDTLICCGHGETTTVAYEREHNDTVK